MTTFFNISDDYGDFCEVECRDYEELNPSGTFTVDYRGGVDVIIVSDDDEIVAVGFDTGDELENPYHELSEEQEALVKAAFK